MNKLVLLLAGSALCASSMAEEPVKDFYFAGYKAIFIPSDTFRVEVGNPELGIQEIKDGTMSFTLKDANGPVPKDVVRIYTNEVRRIHMIYSVLLMDEPIATDSLSLSLAAGSNGIANVKTKYLQASAGAGSQLIVKGETDVLDCTTKGYSGIDTSELKAKEKKYEESKVD